MHYDVIVIGAGGVGSAALYHLARRGVRVIALDRFAPGHNRGSSHGQTRMIRLAYHEHSDYVPLLFRAYELWHELEQISEKKLFYQVGILVGGSTDSQMVSGVLCSAAKYGLAVDQLSHQEVGRCFPGYRLPESFSAVFEQRAGYLMVEECVKAHAEVALRAGAEIHCGVEIRNWKRDGQSFIVETDKDSFSADRLIVTAGAWSSDLLFSLNIPLQVLRKPLFWYQSQHPSYHLDSGCPCFLFDTLGGIFYGFPQTNELGVKLAEHTGGELVENPLQVDRSIRVEEQQRVEMCLAEHLPGVSLQCMSSSVCMYTMSPDGHFIVGCHPEFPEIVFAAGLSGHGFKFTSVLGEILTQLALDGTTPHPIGFLSHKRFVG